MILLAAMCALKKGMAAHRITTTPVSKKGIAAGRITVWLRVAEAWAWQCTITGTRLTVIHNWNPYQINQLPLSGAVHAHL
jgi:hypothetical protein